MRDPHADAAPARTVGEALRQAQAMGVARLDAQWLLADLLGGEPDQSECPTGTITRGWLLAHDDHPLNDDLRPRWQTALRRRAAGEPLAYVLGYQDFCGLRLEVQAAVLIPRPETEDLVSWALNCLQLCHSARPQVMDLGTGSGAIALAIKQSWPAAQVQASDLSEAALGVARRNADKHRLQVDFLHANWWRPVAPPATQLGDSALYDLVVSNPPYIADGDPHLNALHHEPRSALVAAAQGLKDLQHIVGSSMAHLRPGGWLLLEHGHDQAAAVQQALREAGYEAIETRADLASLPRCSGARRPLSAGQA